MTPSVRPTTASTTSETTTRATSTSPERARRAHSFTLDVVSHLIGSSSSSESHHLSSTVICMSASPLSRFSSSTSTCPSLSSFPSTSCTPSCTLSSTTRSSWKSCATPVTRGVRTPTTSPPPSHKLKDTYQMHIATLTFAHALAFSTRWMDID